MRKSQLWKHILTPGILGQKGISLLCAIRIQCLGDLIILASTSNEYENNNA
jgi:hypothetical protein